MKNAQTDHSSPHCDVCMCEVIQHLQMTSMSRSDISEFEIKEKSKKIWMVQLNVLPKISKLFIHLC